MWPRDEAKLARVRALMEEEGLDALVVRAPDDVLYLTDFWGSGAAVVHSDRTVVITGALDAGRAEELGQEVEVVQVKRWAELPEAIAKQTGGGLALVDDDAQLRAFGRLKQDAGLFLEARRGKDAQEGERIRGASRGQEAIFEALEGVLRPGGAEWQGGRRGPRRSSGEERAPAGGVSGPRPGFPPARGGARGAPPRHSVCAR